MLGRKLRKSGQCTDEGVNAEHVTSGLRCLKWDMDLKCVGSRAQKRDAWLVVSVVLMWYFFCAVLYYIILRGLFILVLFFSVSILGFTF